MDLLFDLVAEQLEKSEDDARFYRLTYNLRMAKLHWTLGQLNNLISKILVAKPLVRKDLAQNFMNSPQCQWNFIR